MPLPGSWTPRSGITTPAALSARFDFETRSARAPIPAGRFEPSHSTPTPIHVVAASATTALPRTRRIRGRAFAGLRPSWAADGARANRRCPCLAVGPLTPTPADNAYERTMRSASAAIGSTEASASSGGRARSIRDISSSASVKDPPVTSAAC